MSDLEPVDVIACDLAKSYGPVAAVQGVSFAAPAGQVTAMLGGNGAGKSTTLRLMLGLCRGAGETTYGGRPLNGWPAPHERVGVFLGTPAFHPRRTVRDHLRTLAAGTRISRRRVDEVIEAVGLGAWSRARPHGFSTGMRQRLGLAAALLADPSVLVLDEPINGLDPHGVIAMRETLARHAARGGTVIIASHILTEIALVADRVVMIAAGRVVGDDSLQLLLQGQRRLLVRCNEPRRLAAALGRVGAACQRDAMRPDAIIVAGIDEREVARQGRDLGVLIWELTVTHPTLEEVYLARVGVANSLERSDLGSPSSGRSLARVSS